MIVAALPLIRTLWPTMLRIGAKIPSPNFVTKNRDLLRARLVVLGGEIAAQDRRHANDFEKILGDITAGVTLRIVFVGHVDCRSIEITGHHRERLLRQPSDLRNPVRSECCRHRSYCFDRSPLDRSAQRSPTVPDAGNENPRNTIALTTVNCVVAPPMPRPSTSTARKQNILSLNKTRSPTRTSWRKNLES